MDQKISQLTLGTPQDTDVIPFVDGDTGETKKATKASLKGDTGDAATIEVGTVTTGAPGTDVIVENSGDEHAAVLDFTIPEGEKGDTGDAGAAAFVYIGYASDAAGTGFTLVFDPALNYIAIKHTTVAIPSPIASDFAGLWKNYKGATGATGAPGVSVAQEIPAGTVDGSNVTFVPVHTPLFIVVDGTTKPLVAVITDLGGNGFTFSGGNIVLPAVAAPLNYIVSYYNT